MSNFVHRHSKPIKVFIAVAATSMLLSCRTEMGVSTKKLAAPNTKFEGLFNNNPYHIRQKRYGSQSLLQELHIYGVIADHVYLTCDSTGLISVKYTDIVGRSQECVFKGKLIKNTYWEIYFDNRSKSFPPLFPLLYSHNNIDRIRLAIMPDGNLITDNFFDHSASILILGTGYSGRRQSYFKHLDK